MELETRAPAGNESWKKHRSFLVGIFAAASPIPFFLISCFLGGIIGFDLRNAPGWQLGLALIPFAISPICCCACLVYGLLRHRDYLSWLCVLLSVFGLAENALLLYGMYYIGGHW